MTKEKPKVPPSKIPILGQSADKAKSEEFVRQIMQYLDPIMQNILQSIDGLERRTEVIETIVNGALVDILTKKVYDEIQNKLTYPDAQLQGIAKEKK